MLILTVKFNGPRFAQSEIMALQFPISHIGSEQPPPPQQHFFRLICRPADGNIGNHLWSRLMPA